MRKELIDSNPLIKLYIEFSLAIISYCEELDAKKKYILSRQLLRSGTSIRSNSMEAQNPVSKADIIHKIKIALKKAEETQYWLILCENAAQYPKPVGLAEKLETLGKILGSIISTAKRKTPLSYFLSLFLF